jgi:hypothetical protein
MKMIAVVLAGAFLSVSTLGAMSKMSKMTEYIAIEENYFDEKKTKVEHDELPQKVILGLEDSEYRLWEVQEAFRIEDEQTDEVHYELHLASYAAADKVKSVTFNENGEIISEEDSELGRTEDQEFDQQEAQPGIEGTEPGIDQDQDLDRDEPGMQPGTQPETGQPGTERPGEQY